MASIRSLSTARSAAPSARRASPSAATASSRLASTAAPTAAIAASSSTLSTTSTTPRTASTPSRVAGARPNFSAASRAAAAISAISAVSTRAVTPPPSRCATMVAKHVPRASALPIRAFASASIRSKAGGSRSRRSSPFALTHLSSTVHRHAPNAPTARAKPVMLVRLMRSNPERRFSFPHTRVSGIREPAQETGQTDPAAVRTTPPANPAPWQARSLRRRDARRRSTRRPRAPSRRGIERGSSSVAVHEARRGVARSAQAPPSQYPR